MRCNQVRPGSQHRRRHPCTASQCRARPQAIQPDSPGLTRPVGKVLEFPSQQVQGLAYLDAQLRKLLASKGADQPLIDFAADQLTQTYAELSESEQYSFSITLPPGIGDDDAEELNRQVNSGLEGIRAENHALMIKLVAQLVLAKVRLFQHERDE